MTNSTPKFAVLGAGAWGTAFASLLATRDNREVLVWGRSAAIVDEINQHHTQSNRLKGAPLSPSLRATTSILEALQDADFVVVAISAQSARDVLNTIAGDWSNLVKSDVRVINLMKGIELASLKSMSAVIAETLHLSPDQIATVSGPNLALEIALGQPAGATVASVSPDLATQIASEVKTKTFITRTCADVVGVEFASVLKNVIALGVGIVRGAGFGDNTAATLLSAALGEGWKLALKLGAKHSTIWHLAAIGDIFATCSSNLSRNFTCGFALGQGQTLDDSARACNGVAEGVKSVLAIRELAASHQVDTPVINAIADVVHHGLSVQEAIEKLVDAESEIEIA